MSFSHECFGSAGPHIHVPYDLLKKYLPFLKKEKLNLELYFGSRSFDRVTEKDIIDLRKTLDYQPSLTIHAPFMDLSPGGVDPLVRDVTVQRFNDVLDISSILAPKVIVFHSGYDRRRFNDRVDIWLEGSIETFTSINKRAADMGITLAVENIFEDEPDSLAQLAEEINSDHFGLCFDTGHFNMFSKVPLPEWLKKIKSFIKEVHLHDNSRYRDDHLAIGDGDFDFHGLFREIEGIHCIYTIEAHSVDDVRKSLGRIGGYMGGDHK